MELLLLLQDLAGNGDFRTPSFQIWLGAGNSYQDCCLPVQSFLRQERAGMLGQVRLSGVSAFR